MYSIVFEHCIFLKIILGACSPEQRARAGQSVPGGSEQVTGGCVKDQVQWTRSGTRRCSVGADIL